MRAPKILGIAIGFGLLFAWMESLFLQYGLSARLAARGYAGESPVVLFLAVHCSAYLVMGLLSMSPFFGRYSHAVPFAGCVTDAMVSASSGRSLSVSLPKTSIVTAVSSLVESVSFTASGASFSGLTVIVTIPTSE